MSERGMTLLEVLVAFIIFVMMVTALVALATSGLDTWTAGEERKDVFDRVQRIFDQLAEDLRNTFPDERWHLDAGDRELQHAYLVCDADANRVQRVRFVRGGGVHRVNVDPSVKIRRPPQELNYTDLWEIAWVMDGDPKKPVLHRGVRFFDRRPKDSILNAEDIARTSAMFFKQHFREVDTGVLWIGFRLWTPYTTCWALPGEEVWTCANRAHPGLVAVERPGRCPSCGRELQKSGGQAARRAGRDSREIVGPSVIWDSSRCLSENGLDRFVNHRHVKNRDDPDFCYPEIVRVTLVLESQASENRGTRLTEAVTDVETFIRLDTTRGMPDGPDFVKVDAEWIAYSRKAVDGVLVQRRGARGTEAAKHEAGARARFGETFATDVYVPAFREAVR